MRRVIATIDPFARDTEVYSIDQTFLDVAGFEDSNLVADAQVMCDQVLRWTTIPTCVGIANTKWLSRNGSAMMAGRSGAV